MQVSMKWTLLFFLVAVSIHLAQLARSKGNNAFVLLTKPPCSSRDTIISLFSVYPGCLYFFDINWIRSVNGSSINGFCSEYIGQNSKLTCFAPKSSVLFDGNIPTLAGLDSDTWASQLLTMQGQGGSEEYVNVFSNFFTSGYGLRRVEVVMFNCPEWGMAVGNIVAYGYNASFLGSTLVANKSVTTVSCTSLVRVCVLLNTIQPIIELRFFPPTNLSFVHLAEVTFFNDNSNCRRDKIFPNNSTVITGEFSKKNNFRLSKKFILYSG